MRGAASPTQMCQAFCPASPTEVFFGSSIDDAYAASGERYADSENAFAYRKALRADCTCNGHNPAGLAPVDLALDDSLRPGDVLATTDGLVAYSGIRVGNDQTPDFTPVASFPGLTPQVRARLNDMKVAPMRADMAANNAATSEVTRTPAGGDHRAEACARARQARRCELMLQITARRLRRSHSIGRDHLISSIAQQTVDRRAAVSRMSGRASRLPDGHG